jgi:hypothetical protein
MAFLTLTLNQHLDGAFLREPPLSTSGPSTLLIS